MKVGCASWNGRTSSILLISSKHYCKAVDIAKWPGLKETRSYNERKSLIDFSGKISSNNSNLGISVKWYSKLGTEFILGTTLVNAHLINNTICNGMMITKFREDIFTLLSKITDSVAEVDKQIHPHQIQLENLRNHEFSKKILLRFTIQN